MEPNPTSEFACGGRAPAPNLAHRRPEWGSESRRVRAPNLARRRLGWCSALLKTRPKIIHPTFANNSADVKLPSFGAAFGGLVRWHLGGQAQRARVACVLGAPRTPRPEPSTQGRRSPLILGPGPTDSAAGPRRVGARPCAAASRRASSNAKETARENDIEQTNKQPGT